MLKLTKDANLLFHGSCLRDLPECSLRQPLYMFCRTLYMCSKGSDFKGSVRDTLSSSKYHMSKFSNITNLSSGFIFSIIRFFFTMELTLFILFSLCMHSVEDESRLSFILAILSLDSDQ
jgi:hypothetical protein